MLYLLNVCLKENSTWDSSLSQIFFNFRNICVSVAVFRHILQNILQYITKDRDTYTYITEIEKNLGEFLQIKSADKREKNSHFWNIDGKNKVPVPTGTLHQ
jgi:hypothetical protein